MYHMSNLLKVGLGKPSSDIHKAMIEFEKSNHKLAVENLKRCFRSQVRGKLVDRFRRQFKLDSKSGKPRKWFDFELQAIKDLCKEAKDECLAIFKKFETLKLDASVYSTPTDADENEPSFLQNNVQMNEM